jgi:hypothetical protein
MKNINFYAWLTGENATLLKQSSHNSQKKVMALGTSMLIPVLIWFLNGFSISMNLGGQIWYIAILIGILAAFGIFMIERVIILSPSSGGLTTFRIIFGFLIGLVGSFLLDEVVFHNDIQPVIKKMQKAYVKESKDSAGVEFDNENRMAWRKLNLQIVTSNTIQLQNEFIEEVNGDTRSQKSGYGTKAKVKEIRLLESKVQEKNLNKELSTLENERQRVLELAEERASNDYSTNSLLLRMKAFFTLCGEDGRLIAAWLVFFLLVIISDELYQ